MKKYSLVQIEKNKFVFTHGNVKIHIEYDGFLCSLKYRGEEFAKARPELVKKWIKKCVEEL